LIRRVSNPAAAGRRERGVAAVEAALVLPVLLLLIMGIIDLGRALATKQEVTHATREAVRVYAVTHDHDEALQAFAAGTAGLLCDAPSISPEPCTEGEQVAVSAACDFNFVTPLGDRLPVLDQIGSTAVMRCGG
jgi:Flp pilus assembly protein TadG